MMKILFVVMAVVCSLGYDFTNPKNGDELIATLYDEKQDNFIVFFHAPLYEGEEDAAKAAQDLVDNMKSDIKSECSKFGLEAEDYTFIDVEIELDGTKEKDAKHYFGEFLWDLGFEEEQTEAPADGADAAADGGDAPARRMLERYNNYLKRQLQDPDADAADADAPAEDSSNSDVELKELPALAASPYGLVMRNREGYRVYGNEMANEMCY